MTDKGFDAESKHEATRKRIALRLRGTAKNYRSVIAFAVGLILLNPSAKDLALTTIG